MIKNDPSKNTAKLKFFFNQEQFFNCFVIFNLLTFTLFCIFLFLNKLSFVSPSLVAISC